MDATCLLEAQNAGYVPDCARALPGALALGSLGCGGIADRDALNAAASLKLVADGRE